jgi:Asp-tRNA(Asn)/Glu-tRNA(Gln) amidotransferase C subunit
MANENALGNRWDQKQVSVWLTPRRKEKLQALVASLPVNATPIDAIDRALELATTPIFVPASEIDAARETREAGAETLAAIQRLEDRLLAALAASDKSTEQTARRIQTDVGRVHALAEKMRAMMADAVEEDFDDLLGNETREDLPVSLGDWLDAMAKKPRELIRNSMVVRAMWQSKKRASGLYVSMDFRCELIAADGARPQNMQPPALVRVELIDAKGPLARLDSFNAVCFLCSLSPNGSWQVAVHPLDEQGKPDAIVGSFIA